VAGFCRNLAYQTMMLPNDLNSSSIPLSFSEGSECAATSGTWRPEKGDCPKPPDRKISKRAQILVASTAAGIVMFITLLLLANLTCKVFCTSRSDVRIHVSSVYLNSHMIEYCAVIAGMDAPFLNLSMGF
jgi:hypothetical protein